MPEIWLKYGSTEVVLDIKAENLLDYVTDEIEHMSQEQVNAKLDSISVKKDATIAVLNTSQQIIELASMLVNSLRKKGVAVSINVPVDVLSTYRNTFQDKDIQISKLPNNSSELSTDLIFLSQTSFDPLFGFSGTPTYLLKHFDKEKMLDAYNARDGDAPKPGTRNNALSAAHKFADGFDCTSIEVVIGTRGFAEIVVEKPTKAHQTAIAKLESFGKVEVEKGKASIISPGNGRSTLASALNSLWNCIDATKESGSITLLAECRDGFGSDVLERVVESKIDMEDARNPNEYIDGLENLLYLDESSKKYELMLISTLPDYYAKNRLGFKTFGRIKDALHHILNVHGPRQKVLVVSDGSKVLLRPK